MKRKKAPSVLKPKWPRTLLHACGYAPTTARTYEATLKQLRDFLRSTKPSAFSLEAYERWLVHERYYPKPTAKVYRSAAASYVEHTVEWLTSFQGDPLREILRKGGYSPYTLPVYLSALEQLKRWLRTSSASAFSLADFRSWLKGQGYAPASVNAYGSAVWTVFWLSL